MSDREAAGLRGSVSSCETASNGLITREVFNPKGNRTERWHRGRDSPELREWWLYDEAGRLRSHETTGPFSEISLYDYDARGRLLRITTRSPEGERVAESYTYDDDGSSEFTIIPSPVPRHVQVAVDADAMLRFSLDAVRVVVRQDHYGRPRWRVLYDIDDRIIRKVLFRYDAAGQLIEEGEVNFEGAISQDFRDMYRYDAEGRCIEKEVRRGGISNRRSTNLYNEQGDLTEESIDELPGGLDLSDFVPPELRPARSWTAHYSYEYDEHRNWTARTKTRTSIGTAAAPPIITLRKLQYYEIAV
jgi:YD repeat-containing protein